LYFGLGPDPAQQRLQSVSHRLLERAQDEVTADLVSGKVAAMLDDFPGMYAVNQIGVKLQSVWRHL